MTYQYSIDWFTNTEINFLMPAYCDKTKENKILEIGCFEGLSSIFFADNFLDHPNATLTCVDPFLTIENNDHKEYLQNNVEQHFDYNISVCKNADKITVHKITSDQFFENNNQTFNFIYIDGCHELDFIMRDMENAFPVLEKDGIMWMDDYRGGDDFQIKKVMDTFIDKYQNQCEIIYRGYQIAIRKI